MLPYLNRDKFFQEWIDQNIPTKDRVQMMIVKTENVLTPESLQKMFHLHKGIQNISVGSDKTFQNLCSRLLLKLVLLKIDELISF